MLTEICHCSILKPPPLAGGNRGKGSLVEQAVSPMRTTVSREEVMGALERCYDPCCREREISIVDMGLIESIDIAARTVNIKMVLTTGWCPLAARLLEMIEAGVGE